MLSLRKKDETNLTPLKDLFKEEKVSQFFYDASKIFKYFQSRNKYKLTAIEYNLTTSSNKTKMDSYLSKKREYPQISQVKVFFVYYKSI